MKKEPAAMREETRYSDRAEAGRELADKLSVYQDRGDVVVLGLSRGGVPVAFEVAKTLNAPMDVMVVRKLGVPGHEELAFGAIASGGHRVLNKQMLEGLNLSDACVDEIIAREGIELERRTKLYNGGRPKSHLVDKVVIIVDDGLATGSSMEAAVRAASAERPKEIVVAAPVAPRSEHFDFGDARNVKCVFSRTPEPFYAVGLYYADFSETSDEAVIDLLRRARGETQEAKGGVI